MKTKEEKALKGTLRKCRETPNQMEGEVLTIQDIDRDLFSSDYAYEHAKRMFVELSELGVIQATDLTALIILCDIWGSVCESRDDWMKNGKTIITPNGLEQTSASYNNWRIGYRDYERLCKEFGLTPLARQKISMGKKKDDDPLGKLLK